MNKSIFFNIGFKTVLCICVSALLTACGGSADDGDVLTTTANASVLEDTVQQTTSLGIPVIEDSHWDLSGRYGAKYIINVNNTTGSVITNWKINVFFSQPVKVSDMWNGSYSAVNQLVTITAMDYNSIIDAGDSFEIGFIADFPTEPTILATAMYSNEEKIITGDIADIQASDQTQPVKADIFAPDEGTPVAQNGRLSVNGTQLVNSQGNPIILQGVSTHGIAWFPQYINKQAFQTLRDTMNVDTIRLALYSSDNEGYSNALHAKVDEGVKYAAELGMYVIIDWHVLGNGNPNTDKAAAVEFFKEMSAKYCDYDNVIYEICNEPNGNVTWENDIKPYAQDVISVIRANDSDAVIIVGTPTWSQDVDIVANDPLEGENLMYALHFYADTHKQALRDKLVTAYNKGLPVFVSEFGITDASGSGTVNEAEGSVWIDFLRKYGISYCCWNLSNKDESSALLSPDCTKTSDWTDEDLSQQGKWLKKTYSH